MRDLTVLHSELGRQWAHLHETCYCAVAKFTVQYGQESTCACPYCTIKMTNCD